MHNLHSYYSLRNVAKSISPVRNPFDTPSWVDMITYVEKSHIGQQAQGQRKY